MEAGKRKIIVVDDIKFHLMTLQGRFKQYYDIFPAQSLDELLEILEETIPELILLDISMPENDGFEIIKILKGNPRFAEIPVVFLTSHHDRKSILKGMELGAVDFITKPFSDANIIERIEYICNPEKRAANPPIILAVDDNPSILTSINYLLSDKYKVYTLPQPEQLKDLLTIVVPDLFLLDCNMPVLSGFDLITLIRKFPEHEETPVIFLSSDGSKDNLFIAMDFGACDFLVKPIDEAILKKKISLHVKNYIIRRRMR
jgi:DNA-binding response OmpR family regulator